MADPLTDGQIAEWRRYLDQGDWHQLVTDDEFRALLDTAAEVALLRELVGYDKVTLNTILEEHHAEAGKLAEEVARLRAEVKNLTAERDLARSNYEITQRSYAELNDWVTDYSTDERLAECVRLRAERDAALAAAREAGEKMRERLVEMFKERVAHAQEQLDRCGSAVDRAFYDGRRVGYENAIAAIRNLPLGKGDVS